MLIRVYYEDTDCGGVVYYANYLRYFERARTEFLRERGLEVARFAEVGILFVVAHVEITYRNPARYNDLLEIETWISPASRASFIFSHRIQLQGTDRLIVEGQSQMVCVDASGKPRRLPDDLQQVLSL
jgi:acyl-CoA thioester hydrolase